MIAVAFKEGSWGRATKTKGVSCSIREPGLGRYHRPRRTYIALQAPVGEDAKKYGLAWSQLINGDLGEEHRTNHGERVAQLQRQIRGLLLGY